MLIDGKQWQTIWFDDKQNSVNVIDQTKLPHSLEVRNLSSYKDIFYAIKDMIVRGAPLIGVTGAYGIALGLKEDPSDQSLIKYFECLKSARPTAVNLFWALDRVFNKVINLDPKYRFEKALMEAQQIEYEDIKMCSDIGDNGFRLINQIYSNIYSDGTKRPLNILTHCNAGWLATVDWGTALSPVYKAFRAGLDIHVWVDETRPRNQGASLTAFELKGEGVPHTVIVDNAGGHLMQNKLVDLVIVGSDRTTSTGDVCNKIGTYLKALAAYANQIPFYVALPSSTIDWSISDGSKEIPIENRSESEVTKMSGLTDSGSIETINLTPKGSKAMNPGFDITPSHLITSLITERGIADANKDSLKKLFSK